MIQTRPVNLRAALTAWAYLARSRAGFRFSIDRGEYVWNANGRPVTIAKLERESANYTEFVGDNMRFQTERLLDGRISLAQWQRNMAKEIKDAWRTQYALGRGGWEQMTQSDFGRMGGRLQFQYRRLNAFAEDIWRGDLSDAQIRARAKMYATANRTALFDGRTQAKIGASFIEERRILNPAEHCQDCIGYAALGWQPIGTLPEPGQQSVCRANCKCTKEYR